MSRLLERTLRKHKSMQAQDCFDIFSGYLKNAFLSDARLNLHFLNVLFIGYV